MSDVVGRVSSLQFVGRAPEVEQLVTAFKRAAADREAAAVLVGGEAGVGNGRPLAALAAPVRAADGLVVVGACMELETPASPFGPLVQVLRALRRELEPATFEDVIGPAAGVVRRFLPELA